ncbi:transcription initiation factor TFIID subunit 5 [Fistulifera solaris]|uniref:Transcription initiation factor TFIID subunit 5 n=1 Tax=Fistulifera solaris TaxID=1519565 RepID=A0A1Z5KKC8_FISSO|nr:transcription initiation factor TFIID subunit 5 [Fistulifera solaris]|eukprot:GAX26532.1 transcription initiation factor TFIID subunit 5 [Fistulifera solaris]
MTSASTSPALPTDQAVLEYLQRKGLGTAALELSNLLKKEKPKDTRAELEEEDYVFRNQRTLLAKSTGGSYGSDRDSAWPLVQWGVPEKDVDGGIGAEEARTYLRSFTELQLWVLSLPDHDAAGVVTQANPLERARALLQGGDKEQSPSSVASLMEELVKNKEPKGGVADSSSHTTTYNLPPSAKAELLSVTFALLVHTYCELLEVGMEQTAHGLRDAFQPIYLPQYETELRDLNNCTSTEDAMRLNAHNSQHMEAVNTLKAISVQVSSYQLQREQAQMALQQQASNDPNTAAKLQLLIQEIDKKISILRIKYQELSQRATMAFAKMHDLPFLRRARAVRWRLALSAQTYGLLVSFLKPLLPMSTLLQTKCEIHVERRDPLPFTPGIVFAGFEKESDDTDRPSFLHTLDIAWAVPSRATDASNEKLPFPKYDLDKQYPNEEEASRQKQLVEYNRSLLIHGFRRLEALERKRNYEKMEGDAVDAVSHIHKPICDPLKPSVLMTTLSSSVGAKVVSFSAPTATRDIASIWDEPGIGVCCMKQGNNWLAAGCDDSAVRIFDLSKRNLTTEPVSVLLGHKNGFPVFDIDWNGNALLSAGGDGSIRLWDPSLTGPYGATDTSTSSNAAKLVPGVRTETASFPNGAALAVYRGHLSPVWSVAWSPAGYYFASAGADATARIWVTDRPTPVRLLVGHTSSNVNCITWHPNGNYILTAGDDGTCRLWDVHSGRTVRLLTGAKTSVKQCLISPNGRYAFAADYSGTLTQWDLAQGQVIRSWNQCSTSTSTNSSTSRAVQAMAIDPACQSLAVAGDDFTVRLWDLSNARSSEPALSMPCQRSMIMDLQYTSRNLLLAAGKVVTPVPVSSSFYKKKKGMLQ